MDAYQVSEELIGSDAVQDLSGDAQQTDSASLKQKAEDCKAEGNRHLSNKQFLEASRAYTEAIKFDPTNAVYYSNRAAALTSMEDYDGAVQDCKAALSLDPEYAKAYGRLGAAFVGLANSCEALEAYEKALELEPSNAIYKKAIESLRLKAKSSPSSSSASPPPSSSPFGGLDFSSLMSNPQLMEMASRMMQDPSALQNMMSNPQVAAMQVFTRAYLI
jgi:small glutamine-rich tetratricopeptide repeat-containing protein alpha